MQIGLIIGFLYITTKSEIMKTLMALITFSAVFLSSCSHYYYVANVQNVPLFREKNELRLSGSYGCGDESQSGEAQVAYSITDKLALMANFMRATGGTVSSKDYGKGTYFEGAVGYFKPIAEFGVFEVYGGLGGCRQHHEYTRLTYDGSSYNDTYQGSSDASFVKLFIQPSFGITFNWFDVAFSTRICNITYTSIKNNILGNTTEYEKLYAAEAKSHFNLEPALTLRAGWKNVKVQVQAEYAGVLNNPGAYIGEDWHLSIGMNFAIANRYK
jgi:hypothetical protein